MRIAIHPKSQIRSPWFPATRLLLALALATGVMLAQSGPTSACPKDRAGFPKDCNQASVASQKPIDANSEINNFHRVDNDLYRGARPVLASNAYQNLTALGIKTIINLEGGKAADRESAEIAAANGLPGALQIQFKSFPITAFTHTVLFALPKTGDHSAIALFQMIHDSQKPVFIHCTHGKDRTGAAVMLYRMSRGEETSVEALQEARHYKFSWWNFGLKRTVNRYRDPNRLSSLPNPATGAPENACRPLLQKCTP